MRVSSTRPLKVLAVASGGGHWIQLLRLMPALSDCDVAFVGTMLADPQIAARRYRRVPDASRWDKIGVVRMALSLALLMLKERPDVIISTGAAPGYVALRLGRLTGASTIWVDSIANVDELSMSGRLAGPHADLWLTQWPHLARPEGPHFAGAVI